ncbi:MAG: hypothetical protein Q6L50_05005 [Gloeomargarita sp. GMQP_bins_120]
MIVLTHRFGRLGNRLLISAHLLAYALETGHALIDWGFAEYTPYFVGTASHPDIFRFPPRPWVPKLIYTGVRALRKLVHRYPALKSHIHVLPDPGKHWGNPLILDDLVVKKALFVRAWYVRAPRCFVKHQQTIREWFTPIPVYQQQVADFIQPLRDRYDVLIGLHIRAGDYRCYGGFHGLEMWRLAMERMTDLLPGKRLAFVLCSDENFRDQAHVFRDFAVYFGPGHPVTDLYTLARCDYLIAPPSTYSNWAAFYGQVPICQVGYVPLHTLDPVCRDVTASRQRMEQDMRALDWPRFRRVTYFVDHRLSP